MLENAGVKIKEERPARKEPLSDTEAKKLIKAASTVVIAKGKKSASYPSKEVSLDMIKGPTGNVRAPLLVRGKKMLVGYSAETLEQWFA